MSGEVDVVACAQEAAATEVAAAARSDGAQGAEVARSGEAQRSRDGRVALEEEHHNSLVTLSATVSYKGTHFAGFARQPECTTVQGELERALSTVFARPTLTVCAGRTDAGVHARGQVISFAVPEEALGGRGKGPQQLMRSLNALTPDDIAVRDICRRADGFSARFDAVRREYRYFICTDDTPPLFMQDFSWHVGKPLDVVAMAQASRALIGEHDFKSFCLAASAEGKTTMRNVSEIAFDRTQVMGERMLVITVRGNAFLHSMVRTIVGSLVLVGRHQREIDWLERVLAARDRCAAGPNAPAQGLVFWQVEY